jgi:hypothetical protein
MSTPDGSPKSCRKIALLRDRPAARECELTHHRLADLLEEVQRCPTEEIGRAMPIARPPPPLRRFEGHYGGLDLANALDRLIGNAIGWFERYHGGVCR